MRYVALKIYYLKFSFYFHRQDFLNNPPPTPQQNIQPRRNLSVVQQGAVPIDQNLIPPLPPLRQSPQQPAGVLPQQQQGNVGVAGALPPMAPQQQQGNVGAVAGLPPIAPPPPVMSLADLQNYVLQQGNRLQFTRRQGQQGPQ